MSPETKRGLKDKILADIVALKADIERLEALTQPIPPDDAIGRISRMEAIHEKSINEATLDAAKTRLIQLELALGKIDDPDFGLCVECGEPIAPGRIMLMPESTRCVKCAE